MKPPRYKPNDIVYLPHKFSATTKRILTGVVLSSESNEWDSETKGISTELTYYITGYQGRVIESALFPSFEEALASIK